MKTCGISPKVWAPVAALLTTFVVNWIVSGEFDRTELAQLVAAGMTAVFGYIAGPGDVVVDAVPGGDGGELGVTVVELLLGLILLVLVVALFVGWNLRVG